MSGALFLLFLIACLVLGGIVVGMIRRSGRWSRTYQRLAIRYKGWVVYGSPFYGLGLTHPKLTFFYGCNLVSVLNRKLVLFEAKQATEIRMGWPDRRFKLEVTTLHPSCRKWDFAVASPVSIAAPDFREHFRVYSNQPSLASKVLSSQVQSQLIRLARLGQESELVVQINRGRLTVQRPGYYKDYQTLDDLIRLTLELFELMMLVPADGLQFLHEGEVTILENVKCPICNNELGEAIATCVRCKTPHCFDCWEYNRGCSTYACGETRCTVSGGRRASR